jgi:hypothetical protein
MRQGSLSFTQLTFSTILVEQETNFSPYIVHDDHIFPVGAGDPNFKRKDAGQTPESYPSELSRHTGAVSDDLCGLNSRLRSTSDSFNNSRSVGTIQPRHG